MFALAFIDAYGTAGIVVGILGIIAAFGGVAAYFRGRLGQETILLMMENRAAMSERVDELTAALSEMQRDLISARERIAVLEDLVTSAPQFREIATILPVRFDKVDEGLSRIEALLAEK